MTRAIFPLVPAAAIDLRASAPADMPVMFAGRPMRFVRSYGNDDQAPVILEELVGGRNYAAGQLTFWSMWAIRRAMGGMLK